MLISDNSPAAEIINAD